VGKVGEPKRALWKALPVWLVTLELKRRRLVSRAPNYALLEVNDATLGAFNSSTGALDKNFDSVIILWGATLAAPKLSKKFLIVTQTEALHSRWSLLDHCSDGFVFPLEAGASKNKAQQAKLKAQLFKFGGHCLAAYANLNSYYEPGAPLADTFAGPVLVTVVNPNEMVFDERFLNLRSQKIRTETEVSDLARFARSSGTPVLALQPENEGGESMHLPILPPTNHTRAELIELLVRNSTLAKVVNVRVARLWASVWAALGYPSVPRVHPDQIRALARHRAAGRPTSDELARARTSLELLGGGR
jgi:hypothetical protein